MAIKLLAVLLLTVLLAACGGDTVTPPTTDPPQTPEEGMTQTEFMQTATETAVDINQLTTAMSESTLGQLLAGLPVGLGGVEPFLQTPHAGSLELSTRVRTFARSLGPFAGSDADLPRGTFTYNDVTGTWEGVPANAGNFVAKWSYNDGGTRTVTFTVDWDVTQPTVVVNDGYGTAEVPTDMNASLKVDSATLADLSLKAEWFSGASCAGPILEPSSLSLVGYVGDATGRVDMDIRFTLTDNAGGADRMTTKGDIVLTSGADQAEVTWDIVLDGNLTRGSDCFLVDASLSSGRVALGTSTTLEGETEALGIAFDFGNLVTGDDEEILSVDLSNGVITVNGSPAVRFSGTLDDSNGNGVPGENVTVRFAGGETTTLEALLQGAMRTAALNKLKAHLGR